MIQRIQSIFLLIASILLICTLFLPLTQLYDAMSPSLTTIYAYKVVNIGYISKIVYPKSAIILTTFLLISAFLSVFAIFLYKKRDKQMKISILSFAFAFISCNLIVMNSFRAMPSPQTSMSFLYASLLPVIAIILIFLAYKAIKRDDKLVKSVDRIR